MRNHTKGPWKYHLTDQPRKFYDTEAFGIICGACLTARIVNNGLRPLPYVEPGVFCEICKAGPYSEV